MGKIKEAQRHIEIIYGQEPPNMGRAILSLLKAALGLPLKVADLINLTFLHHLTGGRIHYPYKGDERQGK